MGEWVEFTTIDLGYKNPETGKDIVDITGMQNRPGIDPIVHKGIVYPDIFTQGKKILKRYEKGRKLLLELDILSAEADKIKEFNATPKTKEEVTADWGVGFVSGVTE